MEIKPIIFSRIIASVFAAVGTALLIPGTIGMFAIVILLTFRINYATVGIILTIFSIYVFGNILLWGYFKHAISQISRKNCIRLWIGTIIYNLVPGVFMNFVLVRGFIAADKTRLYETDYLNASWWVAIMCSYYLAVILAAFALRDDLKRAE